MFDSRRPPRRQQNSKVETAGSRFGGIDVLGTDSTVWKDFAIVLNVRMPDLCKVFANLTHSKSHLILLCDRTMIRGTRSNA